MMFISLVRLRWWLLVAIVAISTLVFFSPPNLGGEGSDSFCEAKGASLGLYLGDSPAELQPLDLLGVQGPAAWPVVNPVLTTGGLKSYDGLAGPMLWVRDGRVLLFFEAISCDISRRAIGVAESLDEGVTWRGLGTVLSSHSPDALRRPHVFEYGDQVFMVTDSARGPKLYRSTNFPLGWHYNRTLTEEPLRGVSVLRSPTAKHERWLLVGSAPSRGRQSPAGGSRREDSMLVVYVAPSPLGPWERHGTSPFRVAAGDVGGGVVEVPGAGLIRLGRSCRRGSCSDVQATKFSFVRGEVNETALPGFLQERVWRQAGAWDADRRSYASLAVLPSGKVAAVVVGQSKPHSRHWTMGALDAAVPAARALAWACCLLLAVQIGSKTAGPRLLASFVWGPGGVAAGGGRAERISPRGGVGGQTPRAAAAVQRLQDEDLPLQRGLSSSSTNRRAGGSTPAQPGSPGLASRFATLGRYGWGFPRGEMTTPSSLRGGGGSGGSGGRSVAGQALRLAAGAVEASSRHVVALLAVSGLAIGAVVVLGRLRSISAPFWAPAPPEQVGGQFSRFTLMVMSYEARRSLLAGYIKHYGRCISVGEILVVWNAGTPPNPAVDFPWAAVPIRVRVEARNSLNNRYRPDDLLRYRGVLSLDDDLRLPCSDIERAFATWRSNPHALTGFFPRLAEVSSTPRYKPEPIAVEAGWYNLILSGAAFIDNRAAFPAYWGEGLATARALVDEVQNCDDLLMNFVVANFTRSFRQAPVAYIRPTRRIDVSWWSGVGLSHAAQHFLDDAERCLRAFEEVFARWPLRAEAFEWGPAGKPRCVKGALDCSYLA